MLNTVQISTESAVESVFLTSAKFCQAARLAMRNQTSNGVSRSLYRVAASLSFLRLIMCTWSHGGQIFAICEEYSSQHANMSRTLVLSLKRVNPRHTLPNDQRM